MSIMKSADKPRRCWAGSGRTGLVRGVLCPLFGLLVFAMAGVSVAQAQANPNDAASCGTAHPLNDRTQAVVVGIMEALGSGVTDCANVTDAQLSSLSTLRLTDRGLTALRADDFAGLENLTELYLGHNKLETLQAEVFDDLSNLTGLYLGHNKLESLQEEVFAELENLTYLYLTKNQLTSLPEGVFAGLSNLTYLDLNFNKLDNLPKEVFADLESLTHLYLDDNQLTSLRAGVFADLENLTHLYLDNNELTSLWAGVFADLPSLMHLDLNNNQLTGSIPPELDTLGELTHLDLGHNQLTDTTLPPVLAARVTAGTLTVVLRPQYPPPLAPDRPTITAPSPTSLEVNWAAVNAASPVTAYDVRYREGSSGPWTVHPHTGLATTATISGLNAGTAYEVQVQASNASGSSPWSASGTGQTQTKASPSSPPPVSGPSPSPVEDPAVPVGYLGTGTYASGIGLVSGWVCEAAEVEIEFTHGPTGAVETYRAGYGTIREDTQEVCGDADNGFGLLWNWNRLGAGTHEVRALVDGVELGRTTVTVTTLGEEFARGLSGSYALPDFPRVGEGVYLHWSEAQQNFVLGPASPPAASGPDRPGSSEVGFLGNPASHSMQSGVGLISGWVCEAAEVEIEFTAGTTGAIQSYPAASGTIREDTQEVCGDVDNGFGLLWNWNRLGDGLHTVRALVDGEELGRATVTVTTLGEEFARGLSRTAVLADFPEVGQTVRVEWQQTQQNFVITGVE